MSAYPSFPDFLSEHGTQKSAKPASKTQAQTLTAGTASAITQFLETTVQPNNLQGAGWNHPHAGVVVLENTEGDGEVQNK